MIQDTALFGLSDAHLTSSDCGQCLLHPEVLIPFRTLQLACDHLGIGCNIASGYRSLTRQLSIWERKWRGELPLRNAQGEIIDATGMDDWQKIQAILTWSALPGASRHHWGTDLDVYDKRSVESRQWHFQLTAEEYQAQGPCAELADFLNQHLDEFDFYRPYAVFSGGIAAEPWHISYKPVADQCLSALTSGRLLNLLTTLTFSGKDTVIQHFDEIFTRFVLNQGVSQ